MKEVVSILGIFGEKGIIIRVRYKKIYFKFKNKINYFKKITMFQIVNLLFY